MAASSETRDIGSHASGVTALAFSRDGRQLASGAEGDPVVRAWSIASGAAATGRALRHGTGLKGLAWSGDHRFLATSDLGDRRSAGPSLRLWHMAPMPAEPVEIHRSAEPVRALAIDAAGSVLAIASPADGGLWLWDLKAARLRSPLAGVGAGAVAVAIDAAGDIAKQFGDVTLTPTTFLIDKNGKIIKRYVGEPDFQQLHTLLEKRLAESA